MHEPTEVFYYDRLDSSKFIVCDNVNEDAKCSNKFLLDIVLNMDHLNYLGLNMY